MKLGIYLETDYYIREAELFCSDVYTLILNKLNYDYLFLIGRFVKDEKQVSQMYRIRKYYKYYKLSSYKDLVSLITCYRKYRRCNKYIFNSFIDDIDCLLVMAPSPISIDLIQIAQKKQKKIVVLIRQDTRVVIPQRFHGVKKYLAKVMANYLEYLIEKMVKKYDLRVLALGPIIAERYKKLTSNCAVFISSRYCLCDIVSALEIEKVEKDVKLLFVGRIEINKGLKELFIALEQQRSFNYHLTIVGNGSFINEAVSLSKQLQIDKNITFLGYKAYGKELLDIYRANEILVLPSYSEGVPQVILEAMASGCLVMSSSVGSVPYIISDRINGILFQPHSVDSLLSAFAYFSQMSSSDILKMRTLGIYTASKYAYEMQIGVLKQMI